MKPILIVGGGAAGLTVAKCLARRGRPFRILEQSRQRVDRGLGLWGRAQAVLHDLGLAKLLNRQALIPAAAYRSRNGVWLSHSSNTERNRQRVCTIRESSLLQALEAGLPADAVERGADVVTINQGTDGVTLTLADGRSIDGALVIGADGVHSTVRRVAFPGQTGAVNTGFVSHGGLLQPPSVGFFDRFFERKDGGSWPPLDLGERLAFETLGSGRRFALVPLSSGEAFWFATRPMATDHEAEGTDAVALRELRAAYDGWHAPVPAQ